jgi:hypothetical protein
VRNTPVRARPSRAWMLKPNALIALAPMRPRARRSR